MNQPLVWKETKRKHIICNNRIRYTSTPNKDLCFTIVHLHAWCWYMADLTQVLSQGTAKTADEAKAICQALYDTM